MIQVDGCIYRFHGFSGGTSGDPVLLFLHGFMGSSADWAEVFSLLPSRLRALALDLPGHGRTTVQSSSGKGCFTLSTVAQAIARWHAEQGWPPVILIGYSMGGRLALYLALHHPEMARCVVLESASPGIQDAAERYRRRQRDEQLARELEQDAFPRFLDRWYRQPLFASLRKHPVFPRLLQQRQKNHPALLAQVLREMGAGSQPPLWDKLPLLKKPLLLLVGENDPKFRAISEKMAKVTGRCTIKVIPDCGHNIHRENPGAFVQALREWIPWTP